MSESDKNIALNPNEVLGPEEVRAKGFASTAREYTYLLNSNMGNPTLLMSIPFQEFYFKSKVANERNISSLPSLSGEAVAQRNIDLSHVKNIAKYLIRGLFYSMQSEYARKGRSLPASFHSMLTAVGKSPYLSLPPMIINIRECKPGGKDLRFDSQKGVVYLEQMHVLWVVDGQHRREGMQVVMDFLNKVTTRLVYPKPNPLYEGAEKGEPVSPQELVVWQEILSLGTQVFTLGLEVHLGLSADEERQLFHDTNSYGKKVSASLAANFDSSNPINNYIKETLIGEGLLKAQVVEKDILNWDQDKGVITRKDLNSVCAILFLKKTNIRNSSSKLIEERKNIANKFFDTLSTFPNFGVEGAKKSTVLAQSVVLKAIASLFFEFNFSKNRDPNAYKILVSHLSDFDFSHSNKVFRYYTFDEETQSQEFPGLVDYLPPHQDGVNRDLGALDNNGFMRFGSKHNDIFPIIADMIRWKLHLVKRKHRLKLTGK